MGRTHSEILFSFTAQSLSESSVSCFLLPPFQKTEKKKKRKKAKAFISVPWQCHSAVRKAVAQNAPVQVSEALSGECVMCSIFCFEVQISFPIMMETMLIRWNTVFHMYTGLDGTRVIQSGSCLSCWHSACCASLPRASPFLQLCLSFSAGCRLLCFLHWP